MDTGEFIRLITTSHFVAGAAGGFVRGYHIKEVYGLALMRMLAGGVSAHFVAPSVMWWLAIQYEVQQSGMGNFEPVGLLISFIVGYMGIILSGVVENAIFKRFT